MVWAIDGDGCFQMTNQELATCVINDIPIKVAVINNSSLGIRALRVADGLGWNLTAIGLGMDVDNTVRAGASLWLHANGYIGIGTSSPSAKLQVSGGQIQLDGSQKIAFSNDDVTNNLKYHFRDGLPQEWVAEINRANREYYTAQMGSGTPGRPRIPARYWVPDYTMKTYESNGPAAVHAKAERILSNVVEWFRVPEGFLFHQGHSWARPAEAGTAALGKDKSVWGSRFRMRGSRSYGLGTPVISFKKRAA